MNKKCIIRLYNVPPLKTSNELYEEFQKLSDDITHLTFSDGIVFLEFTNQQCANTFGSHFKKLRHNLFSYM